MALKNRNTMVCAGTLGTIALAGCNLLGATQVPGATPTQGPSVKGYQIVSADGGDLKVNMAGAISLACIQTMSDGSTASLPASASVTWSGPKVVEAKKMEGDDHYRILNEGGEEMEMGSMMAAFLHNEIRKDEKELKNVMFAMATGSQEVMATISGVSPGGTVSAMVEMMAAPTGDAAKGATTFGTNCAGCHGDKGQGSSSAPTLNSSGALGKADHTQQVFAMAVLGGVNDEGEALDAPMPVWFNRSPRISAQDVADMYVWLKTQTGTASAGM